MSSEPPRRMLPPTGPWGRSSGRLRCLPRASKIGGGPHPRWPKFMPANVASVRSIALATSAMSWATSVSTWGNRNWLRARWPRPGAVLVHVLAEGELPGEQGRRVVGGQVQPVGEIAVAGQGEGPGAVPLLLGGAESEQPSSSSKAMSEHSPGPGRDAPALSFRAVVGRACLEFSAGRYPPGGDRPWDRPWPETPPTWTPSSAGRSAAAAMRSSPASPRAAWRSSTGPRPAARPGGGDQGAPPEFARDRGFSEQFRREARTAARLSHPNVVAVYDSGEERGLPWIVMEHVSGRTLRTVLDSQRRLSPETTAELLGPVADALDHAHHAGVVHLDVKPENLLLTSETVKVADFGLVRAAAQRGHGQALAATVHYCAPEVLRGGVVDGRADVYALGVVAWECVSGRPPFEGDARQVVQQHLGGRVPPPSRVVAGSRRAVRRAPWPGPPTPTRPGGSCAPRTSPPPSAPPPPPGRRDPPRHHPPPGPAPTPPPPGPRPRARPRTRQAGGRRTSRGQPGARPPGWPAWPRPPGGRAGLDAGAGRRDPGAAGPGPAGRVAPVAFRCPPGAVAAAATTGRVPKSRAAPSRTERPGGGCWPCCSSSGCWRWGW
jgi:serine/threonine-protein kinase